MKYYAVYKGHIPGVYYNWNDCKEQVHNFAKAKYKSFKSLEDAKIFSKTGHCLDSITSKSDDVKTIL